MSRMARDWSIESVSGNSAPEGDFVRQWLREHNWSANHAFMERIQQPGHQARPMALIASADNRVVGGLFAETQLAWLRISIMAVAPELRSKGLGTALISEAERQAVARGCRHAYVDTMDYQAPGFYLARGFNIVGEIPDWDSHGHSKLYLSKRLG